MPSSEMAAIFPRPIFCPTCALSELAVGGLLEERGGQIIAHANALEHDE